MPLRGHPARATPSVELTLMTSKPFIDVFNVDEDGLSDAVMQERLTALVAPADAIFLDAKLESELVELGPKESRA